MEESGVIETNCLACRLRDTTLRKLFNHAWNIKLRVRLFPGLFGFEVDVWRLWVTAKVTFLKRHNIRFPIPVWTSDFQTQQVLLHTILQREWCLYLNKAGGKRCKSRRGRLLCRNAACDESLASVSASRSAARVFERSEFGSSAPWYEHETIA